MNGRRRNRLGTRVADQRSIKSLFGKGCVVKQSFPILQNNLGGQMLIQGLDQSVFELFTCAKDAAALYIALFAVRPILELLLGDTDGISRIRL